MSTRMARIQVHGAEITAEAKEELPNGDWLMIAKQHGPRCSPGTVIRVRKNEILELAAAEMPADSPAPDAPVSQSAGLAELEAGMAEERKTIPTVRELLMKRARDQQTPEK